MWLDPKFWTRYFKSIFTKQVTVFCDSFLERVLPTFDTIGQEAEKVAEQEFERLGHLPATDDGTDMADLAEAAQDAGVVYYELMTGTRQGLINIAIAGLYHLFEQQLLFFHRRQVLHPSEENEIRLLKLGEMQARLARSGIDVKQLPSWPRINELRLVANTIKHGEGESAEELREIRKDFFVHPSLRDDDFFKNDPRQTIYMPLSGEDIFVDTDDFRSYKNVVLSFWNEFSELILEMGAR